MIIFQHGYTLFCLFFIVEFYNSLCLGSVWFVNQTIYEKHSPGTCEGPVIVNGFYEVLGLDYKQGDPIPNYGIIYLECNAGFTLDPDVNMIYCANQLFDIHPLPECIRKYDGSSTFAPEEINDGYNNQAQDSTKPLPEGSAVTNKSTTCPALVVQNGGYDVLGENYKQGQPIPNYRIVKYKCNAGFTLVPNDTVYCILGSFNMHSQPKCIRACPPKIAPEVEMICEYNDQIQDCTKPVPEGTTVTMKCKPYYVQPNLVSSNVAICQGGSWDKATITCEPECGELTPQGTSLIVNGFSAQQGSFPWHVAIYKKIPQHTIYNYICGGSIISVHVVVSAAHCFADDNNGEVEPVENYHIAAGKYYSAYDAPEDSENVVQKRRVARLLIPKGYRGKQSSYSSDIAVVVMEKPFVFSQIVKPVCVDWTSKYEDEQLKANNHGKVVGWGLTDPTARNKSSILQELAPVYIDRDACLDEVPELFIRYVTIDKFCAGFTNDSSVCHGDSGGGMVFEQKQTRGSKYFLRGVVSAGPTMGQGACDNTNYGVYTKLSAHVKFVQSNESKNRGNLQ